jgi:hypothetical protein
VLVGTGNLCSSQCPGPCRLDGPAPRGTYRFVVASCDGKQVFESGSFKRASSEFDYTPKSCFNLVQTGSISGISGSRGQLFPVEKTSRWSRYYSANDRESRASLP